MTFRTQNSEPRTQNLGHGEFASRFTLHASEDSFTLVELLLVMLIVVIMTGAIAGSIGYVNRKAAEAKTQAILAKISVSLEAYNADWGEYPLCRSNTWLRTEAQTNYNITLLGILAGTNTDSKPYLSWNWDETNNVVAGGTVKLYIVDGFGTPISYFPSWTSTNSANRGSYPNGRVNYTSFDLWSSGADLKSLDDATMADDLKNWD